MPSSVESGYWAGAARACPTRRRRYPLATEGGGAATLITALTSNNLNVLFGLLIPGALIGMASPSFGGNLTAYSYLALTALVLVLAHTFRGLGRKSGLLIITGYLGFVAWLLVAT